MHLVAVEHLATAKFAHTCNHCQAIQLSREMGTRSRCAPGVLQLPENVLTNYTDSLLLFICAAQFFLGEAIAGTHGLPRSQQLQGPSVIQQARGLMNTTTDDE